VEIRYVEGKEPAMADGDAPREIPVILLDPVA